MVYQMTSNQAVRNENGSWFTMIERFSLILSQILVVIPCVLWVTNAAAVPSCLGSGVTTQDLITWYDRGHEYLSQKFCEPAVWFDNFFSNERSDEERGPGNFVRWRNEFSFTKNDGLAMRSRLSANVSLPGATKRLHLLLMREDEDDTISSLIDNTKLNLPSSDANAPLSSQRNKLQLGMRYDLAEERFSRFSVSGGIHAGTPMEPFVKGRYRYTKPLTNDSLVRFIETGYWKNLEGFGETTRIDIEKQLTDLNLLRWSTSANFSEISPGFELNSELALLRQISKKSAISFSLGASGYTDPSTFDTVVISSRYRHNFFRDWLFYEIEPAVSWPKNDQGERDALSSITFRVEIQFERY